MHIQQQHEQRRAWDLLRAVWVNNTTLTKAGFEWLEARRANQDEDMVDIALRLGGISGINFRALEWDKRGPAIADAIARAEIAAAERAS